jgi:predicted TIM-barrel fold metal-dependent hydrolase
MSLPPDQIVISADDHLDIHAMPPDVWSSRLPKEWREQGPHVEDTDDGPWWFCEGRRISPSGRKEKGYISANDHGFRPGQPQTRLEDMDRDGVRAQVVYGPTCTQLRIHDAALHEQVARVYNEWAAEFQREAPDRLVLLPDLPSETLAGLIFSGTLEKRPNVKFVMGEAGLGWIPYVIERLDHELHKYGPKIQDHKIEMLPSEIFARQVFTTYEDEQLGVELIPRIGIDNVMWASDYPHGDSTWPHSRKALAESPLAQHGSEVLRKVTCENVARVYGFPV